MLWDLSAAQIRMLKASGKAQLYQTIYSPISGFVIEKMALKGHRVEPGMPLFKIADLSTIWVEADIYECAGDRLYRVAGPKPQIMEDQITYPIVSSLIAAPRVKYVRGISMVGDSFVEGRLFKPLAYTPQGRSSASGRR